MGFYRTLLAVMVFLFHFSGGVSGLSLMNGGVAVFCFFVISGFYVEMLLSEKYTKTRIGDEYVKAFYIARFFRLYPIYILTTGLVVVIDFFYSSTSLPGVLNIATAQGLNDVLRSLLSLFSNASMLLLNVPSSSDLIIGPSWSIGVEVAFYMIAPFVLKKSIKTLLTLATLTLCLQFIPYGSHAPVLYGFPFFLAGVLARRHREVLINKLRFISNLPYSVLSSFILGMVIFSIPHDIYLGVQNTHALNTLDIFLYPAITAILVPILHERTKSNKVDYFIGQLSYPFYIAHQPVIDFLGASEGKPGMFLVLVVTLLFAGVLTWLELLFVEPWRQRLSLPRESRGELSPEFRLPKVT